MKQRKLKMSLLMVLAILLTGILLPITSALAADGIKTTLDISYGNITIGNDTVVGYSESGVLVGTVDSDGYIITSSTTTTINTITVTDGTHDMTLSSVIIDVNATASAYAFSIQTGAVVNLSLSGTNELISGINCAGLQVPNGASVVIDGSGSLLAKGGTYGAGIGGGRGQSGGSITINGGDVTANGGSRSAGIGGGGNINGSNQSGSATGGTGGTGGSGGSITIYGGDVVAEGGAWGAGIGGGGGGVGGNSGSFGNGGTGGAGGAGSIITISGGEVAAIGGERGAGIGGGGGGNGGNANDFGTGGTSGAGGASGTITISGGEVTATGGERGTGIGGGGGGNGGNALNFGNGGSGGAAGIGSSITIIGANVKATGRYSGAGIGSGGYGGGGTVGTYGSGGARGSGSAAGTINISNATVKAQGGDYSAGIGGGAAGSGGEITITSGTVDARSSWYGAGIGGGGVSGMGGTIIINSGSVTAQSQAGAGIGGGSGGSGGTITINGGSVTARSQTNTDIGSNVGISSCVVTGGSVNASIGCTPTTGGETPVNVYFTVTRLSGADNVSVSALSLSQGGAISYGIEDMRTDANGWLYLYLPAYEGSTTTDITAGGTSYTGYYGLIRDTATFLNPNVIKINQTPPLTYTNTASKEFNYEEEVTFTPEEMAVTGGWLIGGTVYYTYSGTERGTGVIVTGSASAPVNAGSYSLDAILPGDDYYHDAVAAKSFIINPKSIARFTAQDISDQIYSGAAQTPAVTVRDGGTTLVSARDFSVSYSGNTNVGTATADISGQNNYTGTLNKTFQIVPKEIALTLSAVPDATMVGSDVVLTATVSGAVDLPAGTVTFKYGDTLIADNVPMSEDAGSYSATTTWISVPAGEYNLTATYNAATGDNYTCVSNGVITNFSILKYNQPDFALMNGTDYAIVDGVINKTYGDSAFALQTLGKLSGGDKIFTVTSGSDVVTVDETTGNVTLLKSGTAVISALSPSDATYNEATTSVTISVGKAEQSGFGFTDSALETYGDASFTVTAAGGQSTGGVTYAVTAGDDVASVDADRGIVTIHKSGTAVITATRAEDDRYLTATTELTITVAKAVQSGLGFADNVLAKTFSHTPFTIAATGGQSRGAVTYTVTAGSDVVSVNADNGEVRIHKSGTAVIAATRAGDDRYLTANAQLTITVAKAAQSGFGFARSRVAKMYGNAAFTVSATGGQSIGEVTYVVTSGRGVVSVNAATGRVIIQNTGTAVITATRAEDEQYNAATHTITIVVDKAETFVTAPPIAADIEVIGKLSASALSGGEGSVPGHFSWVDPGQTVSASGKYQAVFTPEDTGNYIPSICEVQVSVTSVLVHASTGFRFDLSQASVPAGVTSVNVSLAQIATDTGDLSVMTDLMNVDDEFSGSVLAVYDLALLDQNGQTITDFTGAITVRIPLPDGMSGDLRVFWFDKETETMTDMNSRLEDGWLVFETTHFSYYAIVQMTALSPPATVITTRSDTGGNTLLIVLLILTGVAVVGGLAAYLITKNKRKV